MTSSLVIAVAAIAAALGVAAIAGVLHNRRSGVLRHSADPDVIDTSDLGLSRTGPTIVHFSAVWCGPCAGVRRVVNQVSAEMRDVAHVEIDMDANRLPRASFRCCHCRRRSSLTPRAVSGTAHRACPRWLTCGRPSSLYWPKTGVIG